jgi:hypothetical protein
MLDTHTISFEGSRYSWAEVDQQAKNRGFKERSKYIQWLAENDLERKKSLKDFVNFEVLFLLLLVMCMLMLILIYNNLG